MFVFVVIGGLWKAMGWVVPHGSVVHFDVHGEVMLCMVAATLLLKSCGVHEQC